MPTPDDPTGWFEPLYAAAERGDAAVPWDRGVRPNPVLERWARERGLTGAGRRAVIVGSGLGGDAELIAELGFDTVDAGGLEVARLLEPLAMLWIHLAMA